MLCRVSLVLVLFVAVPARAAIVRGKVTDSLGRPLPGSRVQLIRLSGGPRNAADTISGVDGAYELRTDLAGRFLLLTSPAMSAAQFAPQIGNPFYAGRTDLVNIDIALDASAITPQESAQATLVVTPLPELSIAPVQVAADRLLTGSNVLDELRAQAGEFVVEQGQTGSPAQLLVRGAPVDKTLVDGVSAEQLGGNFNLATVSSSGLGTIASTAAVEAAPAPNPLYAVDSDAGVLSLNAPAATTLHPVLTYSGDAGNLSTSRNEAIATVAYLRADALLSFARFNSDNDLPAARIHLIAAAANAGYHISANTSLRLTLRRDVTATPLPSPYAFYGVAPQTRFANQNLYGSFTVESRTAGNWHNQVRYGMVRERSQAFNFATPATGLPVTIQGANGYSASGTASFLPQPPREDAVTNRDEGTWQTDYPVAHFLRALLTVRYQDERAADLTAAQADRLDRAHFSVAASLQGELRHRFFYEAAGFVDRAGGLGVHGAPRLGLTYVPVRPGPRKFRGTSLHFTAATGVREPSVLETTLLASLSAPRSRTLDFSVDQNILPGRLTVRTTYFHNQFAHQTETLGAAPLRLSNALTYRTQGLEIGLRYRPAARLFFDGDYTYLAALVEQSAAIAAFNPNLATIPVGATTALVGARPFERPPNTGFAGAHFTGSSFTAAVQATFAGRSDGSTNLTLNPTLLLPNRNLSPGYASVDASVTYNITHAIIFFAELDNLLDERHIAPIGYLSTPFSARTGLRIRLGHE